MVDNRPEIVNTDERHYAKHAYKLGNEFSAFIVYADYEQEAFDYWADYCTDKGYDGYFCELYEVENDDSVIYAGNESKPMPSDYLWIEEIR